MGKLIAWNGFDDIKALARTGLHPSTSGMNEYIKKQCNFSTNYQGGYRGYHTIRTVFNELPMINATAHSYVDPTALICMSLAEGETKYTLLEHRRTVESDYDAYLRRFMREWDWNIKLYLALFHEQDNPDYHRDLADPVVYHRALYHAMNILISEAEKMGIGPDKFAVGGLLLTTSMDQGASSPWAWYAHMARSLADSPYTTFFWDTYFYIKHNPDGSVMYDTTKNIPVVEDFKERVNRHIAHVKPFGIKRFVIGETAQSLDTRRDRDVIVGLRVNQTQHVHAMEDMLYEGVIELGAYFAKRDGPASHNGSFAHWRYDEPMVPYSDSAKELGFAMKRLHLGQKRTYNAA